MLQKFGLIKYNRNLIFEKNLNLNSIQSPNKAKITNYFINSYIKNNPIILKDKYKIASLSKTNYFPERLKITKEIDEAISNNINNFISESTSDVQITDPRLSFIKINHNINDDIIYRNPRLIPSHKSTKSKSQINNNRTAQILNVKKKIYNLEDNENQKNSFNISLKDDINNRKEFINKLMINNDSILNKINILKTEFNNNIMNSTDIDVNRSYNLNNKQIYKKNKVIIDKELFELKQTIVELKNKLSLLNNRQSSTNLILFKEKMENELKKEDIKKMNKLIDNINNDIQRLKEEIHSIRDKNKKLAMEINNHYSCNKDKK
jgi:hypothetical protein